MLLVCFWLAFGEDLVGGLGPGEWVTALVPAVDEGADLGVEVLDGDEDSSADGRTVDDGEEDLDHAALRRQRSVTVGHDSGALMIQHHPS